MKNFNECLSLLGYSPNDVKISEWLNSLDISERPRYEDSPVKWLNQTAVGLTLMFEGKLGYEESHGKAGGSEPMVLSGIRFYGPLNTDSFMAYKGKLMLDLDFQCDLKKFLDKLGKEDSQGGISRKVLIWKNIQDLEVGIVLTKDQKNIEYIDVLPRRI